MRFRKNGLSVPEVLWVAAVLTVSISILALIFWVSAQTFTPRTDDGTPTVVEELDK
jgi:hypothetical protein